MGRLGVECSSPDIDCHVIKYGKGERRLVQMFVEHRDKLGIQFGTSLGPVVSDSPMSDERGSLVRCLSNISEWIQLGIG